MSHARSSKSLSCILVEKRISIDAPIENVWAATIDLTFWPTWSPTVKNATLLNADTIAENACFRLRQPFQRPRVWQVEKLLPPDIAVWRTVDVGRQFRAIHILQRRRYGTLSGLQLSASFETRLFGLLAKPVLNAALALENMALKSWCETHHAEA